jgi:hypothetical protein
LGARASSKPLSEIAAAVEKAGYTPIEEASFDGGRWEVEAYQADTKFEPLRRVIRRESWSIHPRRDRMR